MKFLLFLLVVGGTLALFNPGPDDFATFVTERTRDVVDEEARALGGNLFGSVAGALAGEVAGALAGGSVARHNYLLFSTYSLDLNGMREEGGEWRFLGIGGQFFELGRPAMLEEE
jgi:hypothetical protein